MEKEKSCKEGRNQLHSIELNSLVTAFILILGSLVYRSIPITLGVVLGAAISLVNFRMLWKIAEHAFRPCIKSSKKFVLRFLGKMIGLLASIFLVLYSGTVDIAGFAVGLSVIIVGIIAEGVMWISRSPRSGACQGTK